MPDLPSVPHVSVRKLRPISLRATLIVAGLCALAMIWLNESTHHRLTVVLHDIQQAHATRDIVNGLDRALVAAESSQRGYLITGDREYLAPYNRALAETEGLLKNLTMQAPPEIAGSDAMTSFMSLLSQKIGELALTVRMRQEDRPEVVNFVVTSNVGLEQMRAFQLQADALRAQAEALVTAKRAETYRLLNVSRFGLAAGALAAFLAFFLYVNQIRTMRKADAHQQEQLEAERDALESQVRERTSRLTELASHLQQAVEDERAHLARELHDEMGALLTAAKLDVARLKSRLPADADDLLDRLKHLTDTLNQGIALKRRIIEDLRPSSLTNLGLVASLEILCREFADRAALRIETALEPVDLDTASELTIYRVVQEALTNIAKYAQASQVMVTLKNYVYHAEVSVIDNGVGFDPAQLPRASHGLVGMRHRVEASGGRLDINAGAGRGTRITGTIPRRAAKPQSALADSMAAMSLSAPSYVVEDTAPTEAAAPN